MGEEYINVSENGAGRIRVATPNIAGLCINGLSTCMGFVIIGSKGISVIHDESYLAVGSIEKEFNNVGTIIEWGIFFNPQYSGKEQIDKYTKDMGPFIGKFPKQFKGFIPSPSGCLNIHKVAETIDEVNTAKLPAKDPKNLDRRKAVRHLNNLAANKFKQEYTTIRTVPIDLQFDNGQETDPAPLAFDPKRILLTTLSTVSSWRDEKLAREYHGYCDLVCPDELKEYNDSLPPAKLEKLEVQFQADKNPQALLELICAAFTCLSSVSDPDEGAFFTHKARDYISLALKTDDDLLKKEAAQFQKNLDAFESGEIEQDELFQWTEFDESQHSYEC